MVTPWLPRYVTAVGGVTIAPTKHHDLGEADNQAI